MRARYDQTYQRKDRITFLILPVGIFHRLGNHFWLPTQPVSINMRLEMIHSEKWEIMGQGDRFAHSQTNQQRPGQSRTISGCYCIYIFPSASSLFKSSFYDRNNRGKLLA